MDVDEDEAAKRKKQHNVKFIDKNFEIKGCELVQDSESMVYYDCIMTKLEEKYGHPRVVQYTLQIMRDPVKDVYVLFTKWGNAAEYQQQFQHTPFPELAAAVAEFQKVFKQKSGFNWVDFMK